MLLLRAIAARGMRAGICLMSAASAEAPEVLPLLSEPLPAWCNGPA